MSANFSPDGLVDFIGAPFERPILFGFILGLVALLYYARQRPWLSGEVGVLPPPVPPGPLSSPRMMLTIPPEAMIAFLTFVLLVASLFVILSKQYDAADKHWAYGTVGTLIGYWLRPQRTRRTRKAKNSN